MRRANVIHQLPSARLKRLPRGVNLYDRRVTDIVNPGTLQDNLLAWWRLEEDSVARQDAHTTNRDLTDVNSNVGNRLAIINNGADFTNLATQFLDRVKTDLEGGDRDFSIVGWFYMDAVGVFDRLISMEDDSDIEYRLLVVSNRLRWDYGDTNAHHVETLAVDTPYFFYVYHRASDNQLGIKLNNAGLVTSGAGAYPSSTGNFTLGNTSSAVTTKQPMDGFMDMVGVWNKVLNQAEQNFLYNNGVGNDYPWT